MPKKPKHIESFIIPQPQYITDGIKSVAIAISCSKCGYISLNILNNRQQPKNAKTAKIVEVFI